MDILALKDRRCIADIFKIFLSVTRNDSSVSIISENVKINSSLLTFHFPKFYLLIFFFWTQLSELTSQGFSFIYFCKLLKLVIHLRN